MGRLHPDVELLRDISARGYENAIEILELIEAIEAGNAPAVAKGISKRAAGRTALLVRNSLLTRLHIYVSRAYAPVRKGDLHLRRAFDLLKLSPVRTEIEKTGSATNLAKAETLWQRANADARLKPFQHVRHKMLAHLSEPDAQMPLLRYNDVFAVARATAKVMEKLAHGTGVITIDIKQQMNVPKKSIAAFWGVWT